MRLSPKAIVLSTFCAFLLTACESIDNSPHEKTIKGAGVGAATGAVLGDDKQDIILGTVIGAVLGGVVGSTQE
ncbi:MAG: glycine zipper 2TM domain-containing protein [Amylibacter sp.]|nr:glycine zipper 2TM domain-containing protein [Amylibacter sp.]